MPSFVIHLAAADIYLKRHPEESFSGFYRGVVAPDLLKKPESHYGPATSHPGLDRYIREVGLNTPYDRGYYFHLLTDWMFYQQFLGEDDFSKEIYRDYDRMNGGLIRRYNLTIPDEVKGIVAFSSENTRVLNIDAVSRFIDVAGSFELCESVVEGEVAYRIAESYRQDKDWIVRYIDLMARWYGYASEKGHLEAMCRLGYLYSEKGYGWDDIMMDCGEPHPFLKDSSGAKKHAEQLYRKAAGQNYPWAMYLLGELYLEEPDDYGYGNDWNREDGICWLEKAAKAGVEQAAEHLNRLRNKPDKDGKRKTENNTADTVSADCYEDSWQGNEKAAVNCIKENVNRQGCLQAKEYFAKAFIKEIGYYARIGKLGGMMNDIWNNRKSEKCRCILTFLEYLGAGYIDKLPVSCIEFLRKNACVEKPDLTKAVYEFDYTMTKIIGLFDLLYWSCEEKKDILNREYKENWIIGARETYKVLERRIWNYFLHSKEDSDAISWKKNLQDIKEIYILQKENSSYERDWQKYCSVQRTCQSVMFILSELPPAYVQRIPFDFLQLMEDIRGNLSIYECWWIGRSGQAIRENNLSYEVFSLLGEIYNLYWRDVTVNHRQDEIKDIDLHYLSDRITS